MIAFLANNTPVDESDYPGRHSEIMHGTFVVIILESSYSNMKFTNYEADRTPIRVKGYTCVAFHSNGRSIGLGPDARDFIYFSSLYSD